MSTYFFLKSTVMTLIPTLSIASDGAVGSVLFFAKERLGAVSSPKIAVPQASATSINLLKILLQEDHGSSPVLVSMTLPEIAGTAFDGALVIGDYALSVDAVWSKLYHRVDLGQWWKSKYGRPMVFGLWAARAEWADARPTEFKAISEALSQSLEIGLGSAFPQVLAEAHLRTGLACDRLEFYYRSQLSFAFDNRHLDGIEKYRSLCERYDLLPNTTPLQGAFQQISNCYT
jgi:chorismate dehydratase